MSMLTWDTVGERWYETGVDRGVLYTMTDGTYDDGVAWDGLTTVTNKPTGADKTALYADNIKYLNLIATEEFEFSIEAYQSPEEFDECDGTASPSTGVRIGQQKRKGFGFCYRSRIGNDTDGTDKGYKIHLIYNAVASPAERAYATINDSPEAMTLSWDCSTTPVQVTGHKPTAYVCVDSTKADPTKLASLEKMLYGDESASAKLPSPDEVIALFQANTGVG